MGLLRFIQGIVGVGRGKGVESNVTGSPYPRFSRQNLIVAIRSSRWCTSGFRKNECSNTFIHAKTSFQGRSFENAAA
jgi:hypothetical protein